MSVCRLAWFPYILKRDNVVKIINQPMSSIVGNSSISTNAVANNMNAKKYTGWNALHKNIFQNDLLKKLLHSAVQALRFFFGLPPEMSLMLPGFLGMLEPRLRYGVIFQSLCHQDIFNSTFRLQKRAFEPSGVWVQEVCKSSFRPEGILTSASISEYITILSSFL